MEFKDIIRKLYLKKSFTNTIGAKKARCPDPLPLTHTGKIKLYMVKCKKGEKSGANFKDILRKPYFKKVDDEKICLDRK